MDERSINFLFIGQEDSYAYLKNLLTEVQSLDLCSVEIGITYTNQKDKIDIWKISEARMKVFTKKAVQFPMYSNISVQCTFFEGHFPSDPLSQFEFSGSGSNMMEDKQILCV